MDRLQFVTKASEEAARWLERRGLDPRPYEHWFVEIRLAATGGDLSTLDLNIYPGEWGIVLRHGAKLSSIRVTDAAFADERDDLGLIAQVTTLDDIGALVEHIEATRGLRFPRYRASVRSNLVRATSVVRTWLNTL